MDGFLVVDKPRGYTSHDVVSVAKRILKANKVGHLGTLDPDATGVLPLAINKATKLAAQFSGGQKEYTFDLIFGISTDSDDATGKVVSTSEVIPTQQHIRAICQNFVGELLQRPPAFSAKKISGVRAYKLARKDIPLVLEAKPVTIFEIELVEYREKTASMRAVCSGGTYVRSICRDMAEMLGSKGHAANIRRLRSGIFTIAQAVDLQSLSWEMVEPCVIGQ